MVVTRMTAVCRTRHDGSVGHGVRGVMGMVGRLRGMLVVVLVVFHFGKRLGIRKMRERRFSVPQRLLPDDFRF